MPKNSIADEVLSLQNLVTTAKAVAAEVPGMDVYIPPLEQALTDAKDVSARLQMRKGLKQAETQERKAVLKNGRKQASRVRSALKAHFGVDSERLVEFGSRPIRPRTKKAQKPGQPAPGPTPQPPTPHSPTQTPAAESPTPAPASKL